VPLDRERAQVLTRGELHGLATELGLLLAVRFLEEQVNQCCGPRYHRQPNRGLTRYGYQRGVVTLAGLVSMGLGVLSFLLTVWMNWHSQGRIWMTGNLFLLLSVMLELIGVQFISMGLIGELLTRTYFERQGKSVESTLQQCRRAMVPFFFK
jgi:hypothetical protein